MMYFKSDLSAASACHLLKVLQTGVSRCGDTLHHMSQEHQKWKNKIRVVQGNMAGTIYSAAMTGLMTHFQLHRLLSIKHYDDCK
jgi:hypothetical protein